ncbi:crossover junction endonuclease MUS81 [Pararge aegeria]|uniref:crossover junction endonuclease MUS81 n=1 Tax=Pararge aegeria TaxID=116150 RepID=UPI0019D1AA16|nr:crossover junction endonuclease MUS81 [Pararge aegeria]
MSVVNGKRITFKRVRPNPLFNDWLEELHEEAKQKGSKLESMLREALSSISKYPLPLQSGAECAILKGFDKRLCLFIDKRLDVYKKLHGNTSSQSSIKSVSDDDDDLDLDRNTQSTLESCSNPSISSNLSPISDQTKSNNLTNKNDKKTRNIPVYRSGSYALLMGLADLKKKQTMSKGQLTIAAQKYSEGDIGGEWKNMTKLIKKGLVNKSIENRTPRFCLTEEGFAVVKELNRHTQKSVNDVVSRINQGDCNELVDNKSKSEINDLLYDENKCLTEEAKDLLHDNRDKIKVNDNVYDDNKCPSKVKVINGTETNSTHVDTIKHDHATSINSTRSVELNNCNKIEDIDYSSLIEMEAGSFDIILLIDIHETSGLTKKNDPTVTQFNKYPELKHEYRSLKVGDFTWIARDKKNKDLELVLPYVVERKRMDDLGHSIKDGRFHEQKFRLRKCGLYHVIYMVENHGSSKHVGLPMQSLMQALANTRVQDGFKVHVTESLGHSVSFLATMTLRLMYEYKDKRLKGRNGEPKADILMTFEHFSKSSVKNRALSVTETFIKLLLQLKGMSVEKALTITNVFKTPRLLIEKYQSCDQKEGEILLANLRFGELNRSVGPTVSKSVYQLFTLRNMK